MVPRVVLRMTVHVRLCVCLRKEKTENQVSLGPASNGPKKKKSTDLFHVLEWIRALTWTPRSTERFHQLASAAHFSHLHKVKQKVKGFNLSKKTKKKKITKHTHMRFHQISLYRCAPNTSTNTVHSQIYIQQNTTNTYTPSILVY